MREQVFIYRGEELISPLCELIDWTSVKISSMEEIVSAANAVDLKSTIKNKNIGMTFGHNHQVTTNTEKSLNDAKWSLNKAKNWLRECQRTPTTEWVLDFSDLDWLYRPKKDI